MLSEVDFSIAVFVMGTMIELVESGVFTSGQFDAEVKAYINSLLTKGLTTDQMKQLFKIVGMDIQINSHEVS
jgi:hypothetical protein